MGDPSRFLDRVFSWSSAAARLRRMGSGVAGHSQCQGHIAAAPTIVPSHHHNLQDGRSSLELRRTRTSELFRKYLFGVGEQWKEGEGKEREGQSAQVPGGQRSIRRGHEEVARREAKALPRECYSSAGNYPRFRYRVVSTLICVPACCTCHAMSELTRVNPLLLARSNHRSSPRRGNRNQQAHNSDMAHLQYSPYAI